LERRRQLHWQTALLCDIGAHHTDFAATRQKKMKNASSPWWSPARHADRRGRLVARGRIRQALAGRLCAAGFTEIECGQLQVSPGNETHLHAFGTQQWHPDGTSRPLYLHTSPEFACKRLLAAGETRIFDFARVFRNREAGALHAPEFTLLEWYRAGEAYEALMADCAAFLRLACAAAGTDRLRWRGLEADPALEPERLTLREAFLRHAGLDLARLGERDAFALAAAGIGIRIAGDDTWSDIFSRVLSERIEPRLGIGRATILCEYPVSEAALARPKPGDPAVAERFELYACGVELANAFGELTDAAEQRRRFEADMAEKQRIYGESYPLDEDFLAALAVMPEASGAALGFDRLVMLAVGATHIEQVLWTPFPSPDEARP
jgi:lysyl-tRNA synthetase class 2